MLEANFDLTQKMKQKLEKLDSDFKTLHYDLVDVVDGEESFPKEQEFSM